MSVTFRQEFLRDCRHEAGELLRRHWEQIAVNREIIKLNPDWEAYEQLEDSGALKIFTARSEGILVGYFVVLVRRHLHYIDHLFGFNDVIYLAEEYRRGMTGARLIKFAEKCLREDGVSVLVMNTKLHYPLDSLLVRAGFTHVENIYSKVL